MHAGSSSTASVSRPKQARETDGDAEHVLFLHQQNNEIQGVKSIFDRSRLRVPDSSYGTKMRSMLACLASGIAKPQRTSMVCPRVLEVF